MKKLLLRLLNLSIFKILPDKLYISIKYFIIFGKKLDLKCPKTFNEKMQWLKLNDRKEKYTCMVDKIEVKKIVSKTIGKKYVIDTLGIWDSFDNINFDKLPDSFVLKCTHDSGSVYICKNKKDIKYKSLKKYFNKKIKENYYWKGREWPYKNVKPKIIAEPLCIDKENNELFDYKFFCFNGKAKFYKIDFDRFVKHKANYYDLNGEFIQIGESRFPPDYNRSLPKPKYLNDMINISETLSSNIRFLRVDFYIVNDELYVGELTFYPNSGFDRFVFEDNEKYLGDLLKINSV